MLRTMRALPGLPVFLLALSACAVGPTTTGVVVDPAQQDQAVRELLRQVADNAVNQLGRPDGFRANPRVRIPLPGEIARFDKTLRRFGLERHAEELELSLNRAAEAALPAVKPSLFDALRALRLIDAAAVVHGGEQAATRLFREHSEARLVEHLKPAVATATSQVAVTVAYKRLLRKLAPLEKNLDVESLDLDAYITRAALDGLYLVMADEERRLRRDPRAHPSELLRKVFR